MPRPSRQEIRKPANFSKLALCATALFLLAAAVPARAQTVTAAPAASSGKTTPDIGALMRQVQANQNKLDKIRENYACRDARVTEKLDKHGRIKKQTSEVYEISFLGGREIERLVEKNGEPLSAKAQKKEDERIRKEVEKYEREEKDRAKREKERRQAEIQIQDFIRADRFYNPRRETMDGREVIAFDFERNPHFKAHTLAEKLAQSLEGTIWIDAQASEVVRLTARFDKNFGIGWGILASVHRGTAIEFEQTLEHNQVWLPVYSQIDVSARALFLSANENVIDRYSNYQRFHVRSTFPLGKPDKP
jgi:hypothetical protein